MRRFSWVKDSLIQIVFISFAVVFTVFIAQITISEQYIKECSNGIRVILKTFKRCAEAGNIFRIEDPSENVINVLGLSALQQMLLD